MIFSFESGNQNHSRACGFYTNHNYFHTLGWILIVTYCLQLFLNPLEQVYGSQNLPELLLKCCKQHQEPASKSEWRKQLHILGYQLSIQEWILDHEVSADEIIEECTHELLEEEIKKDSSVEGFVLVEKTSTTEEKDTGNINDLCII